MDYVLTVRIAIGPKKFSNGNRGPARKADQHDDLMIWLRLRVRDGWKPLQTEAIRGLWRRPAADVG